MFIESMDGELYNTAHLRSICPINGQTEDGRVAFGIAAYWAASAVSLTEDPEEAIQLGYYTSEAELRHDYDRFLEALAHGNTQLFRFGSNY